MMVSSNYVGRSHFHFVLFVPEFVWSHWGIMKPKVDQGTLILYVLHYLIAYFPPLIWITYQPCVLFLAALDLSCSVWDLVPDQGSDLSWEHGVLATGPPGKS